jgi:predicted P-loop ATPase
LGIPTYPRNKKAPVATEAIKLERQMSTKVQKDKISLNKERLIYIDSPFQKIIDYLLENKVRKNLITQRFEIDGNQLEDARINKLFVDFKLMFPDVQGVTWPNFERVLMSDYVPTFNPIVEFLDSLAAIEGDKNIEAIVDSLQIVKVDEIENDPDITEYAAYTRVAVFDMFKKWIVGMVASVFDRNYNPLMFVLIGEKGCGKTEFFRRLLPDELKRYFAQSKFNEGKDSEALMCEALLILNDELDGLHSNDARTFRNMISTHEFTFRRPYAKTNTKNKRLATVCGTANDRAVILEPEHNRRIIPVEIKGVDHSKYNAVDKAALLAEAYSHYKAGFDWNLTRDEIATLSTISNEFETISTEVELVQKFFAPCDDGTLELTATEIQNELVNKGFARVNINKLGQALRRLGYKRTSKRKPSGTTKVYGVRLLEQFSHV